MSTTSPSNAALRRFSGVSINSSSPSDSSPTWSQYGGLADVLGRDAQRPSLVADLPELLPERAAQDRVDARRRLVEEHEGRVVHERGGQGEAALHPAGHLAHLLVAVLVELHPLQDVVQTVAPTQPQPVHRGMEAEVLPQRQVREQRRDLRQVPDPLTLRRGQLASRASPTPSPTPPSVRAARRAAAPSSSCHTRWARSARRCCPRRSSRSRPSTTRSSPNDLLNPLHDTATSPAFTHAQSLPVHPVPYTGDEAGRPTPVYRPLKPDRPIGRRQPDRRRVDQRSAISDRVDRPSVAYGATLDPWATLEHRPVAMVGIGRRCRSPSGPPPATRCSCGRRSSARSAWPRRP